MQKEKSKQYGILSDLLLIIDADKCAFIGRELPKSDLQIDDVIRQLDINY